MLLNLCSMAPNQLINIVPTALAIISTINFCDVLSLKIHRMNCRKEATFKANDRDYMVMESSSKFITSISVLLLPHCARRCIKTSECKSVIFKKIPATPTEKNCQLLNTEKSGLVINDKQSVHGWIYYEPLQQGTSRCPIGQCADGYLCTENCSSNSYTCVDINECESNPCQNGATCNNLENSYSCSCVPGYSGTNCETNINECQSQPCLNGGTCTDHVNFFSCTCTHSWKGSTCETLKCESGWILEGSYCYHFSSTETSWSGARSNCQNIGGDLVTIKSSTEFNYIKLKISPNYWVGATDSASEGTFKWVDGTSLSYTAWCEGEPNNYDSSEHCAEVSECGGWNDNVCSASKKYVCKKAA